MIHGRTHGSAPCVDQLAMFIPIGIKDGEAHERPAIANAQTSSAFGIIKDLAGPNPAFGNEQRLHRVPLIASHFSESCMAGRACPGHTRLSR
jgi:hypothetical protein